MKLLKNSSLGFEKLNHRSNFVLRSQFLCSFLHGFRSATIHGAAVGVVGESVFTSLPVLGDARAHPVVHVDVLEVPGQFYSGSCRNPGDCRLESGRRDIRGCDTLTVPQQPLFVLVGEGVFVRFGGSRQRRRSVHVEVQTRVRHEIIEKMRH